MVIVKLTKYALIRSMRSIWYSNGFVTVSFRFPSYSTQRTLAALAS